MKRANGGHACESVTASTLAFSPTIHKAASVTHLSWSLLLVLGNDSRAATARSCDELLLVGHVILCEDCVELAVVICSAVFCQ